MFKYTALFVALFAPLSAHAATDEDLRTIREQIQQLKQSYEQRIAQLEQRLQQAETGSRNAENTAAQAQAAVQQASRPATGSENSFNPAVSLILSGTYGQLKRDPAIPATGFAMSAHTPPERGFSLGESELSVAANIDPDQARREKIYGSLQLSVSIKADGNIENIEVSRSSGHRILDAAAMHIVKLAAPYPPLPTDITRDYDILTFARTWTFTPSDRLESE